jgi:hypothetical protein
MTNFYHNVDCHHCCLRCGWVPWEDMIEYRRIHAPEPICLQCGVSLVELPAQQDVETLA